MQARLQTALTACDGNGWTHNAMFVDVWDDGTVRAGWTAFDDWPEDHFKRFESTDAFDEWMTGWEAEIAAKGEA